MSRSAAGVDYRPFQVFQKLVLSRSRDFMLCYPLSKLNHHVLLIEYIFH